MKQMIDRSAPYPFVSVLWIDSAEIEPNAELALEELPAPQRILQVGMLTREEEDYVVVSGAYKPECNTFDYSIAIPRFSIVEILHLDE